MTPGRDSLLRRNLRSLRCSLGGHRWDDFWCRRCGAVRERDDGGRNWFLWSALYRDHEAARSLLSSGANVGDTDADQRTALHYAEMRQNFEMAELLLEHGADIEATDRKGMTPLHCWALANYTDGEPGAKTAQLAHALIRRGAKVDAVDSEGRTPLELTAYHVDSDQRACLLLAHGARIPPSIARQFTKDLSYTDRDHEGIPTSSLRNTICHLIRQAQEAVLPESRPVLDHRLEENDWLLARTIWALFSGQPLLLKRYLNQTENNLSWITELNLSQAHGLSAADLEVIADAGPVFNSVRRIVFPSSSYRQASDKDVARILGKFQRRHPNVKLIT